MHIRYWFSLTIGLLVTTTTCNAYSSIVTYNFSGELTSVDDLQGMLGEDRNLKIGDSFQAIYTIDSEAYGRSNFTDAILNFQFYVNNINLVDSAYRVQYMRVVNGFVNFYPADWIEIYTVGGKDNYSFPYGINSYGEYIDSDFWLTDLTGTALDMYEKPTYGNMPLSLDMDRFSFGHIGIIGKSTTDPLVSYQLRGDVASFSNNGFEPVLETTPVPIPASAGLLFSCLAILGCLKRRLTASD
jgi:hypothetical protein